MTWPKVLALAIAVLGTVMLSRGIDRLLPDGSRVGHAWVLWLRDQPHPFAGGWSIVEALETRAECQARSEALKDRGDQRAIPLRSSYGPEGPRPMLCLPHTMRPAN